MTPLTLDELREAYAQAWESFETSLDEQDFHFARKYLHLMQQIDFEIQCRQSSVPIN